MILYRIALTLAAPAMAGLIAWRLLRQRERWSDVRERLGAARDPETSTVSASESAAGCLWVHAASNGEATAARPVIEALMTRHPDIRVIVTTNTVTGRDLVRSWAIPRIAASLAPLDYRLCLKRFASRVRPSAMIVIENELWPNRLHAVHALGCPVALVGARVSARSERRWARLKGLLRPLLAQIALAAPQDAGSAQALQVLGVPHDRLVSPVSLKAAVVLARPRPEDVATLGFARAETLLAASTHAGEEEQILSAFQTARTTRPDLRLILAPRHPPRGPEVAALIAMTGLPFAVRSKGEAPEGAAIYLVDTLGEMPLWYSAAELCFVGGSLVEKGGHTPYEPAQFDCALLTGPNIENAASAYATLSAARAVIVVDGEGALARALSEWTPDAQHAAAARARSALSGGAIAPLAAQLSAALGLASAPPRSAET